MLTSRCCFQFGGHLCKSVRLFVFIGHLIYAAAFYVTFAEGKRFQWLHLEIPVAPFDELIYYSTIDCIGKLPIGVCGCLVDSAIICGL